MYYCIFYCLLEISVFPVLVIYHKPLFFIVKKMFLNGFNVPIKFTLVFTVSSLVSILSLHQWRSILTLSPFE